MNEQIFFLGLALLGWGWALLDGSFQRDVAQHSQQARWLVIGLIGFVMMIVGGGMTLPSFVNWLASHVRIV